MNGDDVATLVTLFHAAEQFQIGRAVTIEADVRDLLAAPGLDLARRTLLISDDAGRPLGFAAVHPAPQVGQSRAHLVVSPAFPTAVSNTLLGFVDGWLRADGGAPATLFQLPTSPAVAALTAHGWTVVHSYTRMIADLDAPPPAVPDPRDVQLRVAHCRTVHAVIEEAVAGHWNHQARSFADFMADQRRRPGHDPSLWWLAEVDGRPAGAVVMRDPPGRAWVAWLGVLPEHRGRGLAGFLLRNGFAALRERGHHTVGVDVDTHNATGATRVYRAAGMATVGRSDQWSRVVGPVDDGAPDDTTSAAATAARAPVGAGADAREVQRDAE